MLKRRSQKDLMSFPIRENVDVHIALSRVNKLHWMEQASELDRALISTILSELGTNIVKYAHYGHLTVEFTEDKVAPSVKIQAQDDGPGIADISLALKDHYTTGSSLGLGLPGVKRMADDLTITSTPGRGTTVVAIKKLDRRFSASNISGNHSDPILPRELCSVDASAKWDIGSYTRPMLGQIRGGDLAITIQHDSRLLMVMVDVTGHGERAFELGNKINSLVQRHPQLPTNELMLFLHRQLIGTIGAAVGILSVDPANSRFNYLGVGNTGAARVSGERWRAVSKDGLVGSRLPSLTQVNGALATNDAFLMWTDGIPEIEGPKYLRQHTRDPAGYVARELVNSLGKPHDDAGCIVFRWLQ